MFDVNPYRGALNGGAEAGPLDPLLVLRVMPRGGPGGFVAAFDVMNVLDVGHHVSAPASDVDVIEGLARGHIVEVRSHAVSDAAVRSSTTVSLELVARSRQTSHACR
jgi:hypothetical protein